MTPEISLNDGSAWDDSALIDSWDEAVNEYKKYHSIQRSGKRLEDVLDEDELEQLRGDQGDVLGVAETNSRDADGNIHADPEVADGPEEMTDNKTATGVNQCHAKVPSPGAEPKPSTKTTERSTVQISNPLDSAIPQALLGNVPDENLKNLMMSWYYAGYYTGLHVGQHTSGSSGKTTSK